MSRRGFLRATAVGSLGAAGFVLIGCGEEEETPTPTPPAGTPGATITPAAGEIGTVDVLGLWGAEELESFEAMVAPWQQDTGGQMNFTGERELIALLTTRVEGGNPPDIAIPAEIGLLQRYAQDGLLVPLSDCDIDTSNYPDTFRELGTVDGTEYGVLMKADSKATIWYNPRLFEDNGWDPLDADSSWDDLIDLSEQIRESGIAPWSMGVESAGDSGWPGTDWIQQILLNEHGADVYDDVISGEIPFTDERVRDSWEKFGEIALTDGYTVQGGAEGINATNFQNSVFPPFEEEPQAAMVYLGSFAVGFITEQFPDAQAGEDYDFFPFPGGGVTGGANIAYAFNSDAGTCSLMEWLASAEAQEVWVERGGFTSLNEDVSLDAYPNEIARSVAESILEAEDFRFDLDDAIGGNFQQAFFTGVTEYLQNPGDLDRILSDIEAARET